MFLYASTFILVLISVGIYFRKNSKIHIPIMVSAFILDLSLVLVIEIMRHAVEDVVENVITKTDPFVLFHATISLFVLVFYVILAMTGFRITKNRKNALAFHRIAAIMFVILRLANYITSFSVAEHL